MIQSFQKIVNFDFTCPLLFQGIFLQVPGRPIVLLDDLGFFVFGCDNYNFGRALQLPL